jgi:cation transport ATPase
MAHLLAAVADATSAPSPAGVQGREPATDEEAAASRRKRLWLAVMAGTSRYGREYLEMDADNRRRQRRARLVVAATLTIPLCVGLTVAFRWGDAPGENFYTTISQVIATLFVAIAVEFFTRVATERRPYEAVALLLLMLMGWTGFFACIRALAGNTTSITAGVAATGVTATELLVSLALYDRIVQRSVETALRTRALWLLLPFLAAPVLVLIVA